MKKKKIHIIGAGFSGLAASAFLASEGHSVEIFEKNTIPGGRARKLEENGFRFDMGPGWYWMPEVFERFFRHFDEELSDYYKLKRLDPSYRIFFNPGDYIDVPAGMDQLLSLFEDIETGSSMRLQRFLDKARVRYQIGMERIVYMPSASVFEYFRRDIMANLSNFDFFRSLSTYVDREFRDERLRQILKFPVLFLGASPDKTPAFYSLMNYADLKLGTWYPEGGMYGVVQSMKNLSEKLGVQIHLNAKVEEILCNDHLVRGLKVNNNIIKADAVIAAADYHHVEQSLLPADKRKYSEKYWESRVMAPSGLLFYVGVNKRLKELRHHNLFFDTDFDKHASEIYDHPQWPGDPAIYVSCNSVTDSSVAPEGHENLIILIPVASGLPDNEEIRDSYFDLVMERLEKITGQSIKKHVVYKKSYAHQDFINDYHSFKGNAYGLANTLRQTAFLKPSIRNPKLKNLFYSGQLTVPGPGVPPAIISGQIAAGELIGYFGK